MNIVQSLAAFLQSSGVATQGKNLFISRAPASGELDTDGQQIPQNIWWLKSGGPQGRQGKFFVKPVDIYYRDRNANNVYDLLSDLEETLTCAGCVTLDGFDVVQIEGTGMFSDQDLDDEERTVGLLQINVIIFKKGC
jgi:hypothetical protein